MCLMLLWANDFRTVFWVSVIPACLAVAVLLFGVREPERKDDAPPSNPIQWANLKRMGRMYWWVVAVGSVVMMARFSEAFLLLRAQQGGMALPLVPLVMVRHECGVCARSLSVWASGRQDQPHQAAGVWLAGADGRTGRTGERRYLVVYSGRRFPLGCASGADAGGIVGHGG